MGGGIDVDHIQNDTTTTLKIPLTMAIMDGMEVSVGDSMFTIPINSIQSSLKVAAGDVIHDPAIR